MIKNSVQIIRPRNFVRFIGFNLRKIYPNIFVKEIAIYVILNLKLPKINKKKNNELGNFAFYLEDLAKLK